MVEPYATLPEYLSLGHVSAHWRCLAQCTGLLAYDDQSSLPKTRLLVQRMVNAHMRGAQFAETKSDESAQIAAKYISISAVQIRMRPAKTGSDGSGHRPDDRITWV
jgi:ABC-type nitrate/sulfonate/bicarbonate transport system substrate-binding protein